MDSLTHLAARALESRQTRCYVTTFGRRRCTYNRWGGWGRWVLLGVILFLAILIFFLFACTTARRRRKANRKPFMGTSWAVPAGMKYTGGGAKTENGAPPMAQGYENPPPQYGAQNTAGGANADYYGSGNQYGNNAQYQPPSGPPPPAQSGNVPYESPQQGQYQAPTGPPPAHVR